MRKNKNIYFFMLLLLGVSFAGLARAQTENSTAVVPGSPSSAPNVSNAAAKNKTKKKIKINFEDEAITGNYDVPDTLFLNSRRLIKYKELFNKRTNFIEEIESNKGLFNEHQK